MKLPSLQFYPADWRKDPAVQSLSFHDRGVWFEILCLMHESEQRGKLLLNGKPMPEDALARLLGLDKQILTKTLTTLLDYGVASRCEETNALMNRRMVRDESLRKVRQEAGKMGGNPFLLKQKSTKTKNGLNQNQTPSSSVSSSPSTSKTSAASRAREPVAVADFQKAKLNGKAGKSQFDESLCREYVDFLVASGRSITNPPGLAHSLYASGESDDEIQAWIDNGKEAPKQKRKVVIP